LPVQVLLQVVPVRVRVLVLLVMRILLVCLICWNQPSVRWIQPG
jgi:hypothetical protein